MWILFGGIFNPYSRHTFSVTVWLGQRLTAALFTNLPVPANRWIVLPPVPLFPELSFTDGLGLRAAAERLIYFPVLPLQNAMKFVSAHYRGVSDRKVSIHTNILLKYEIALTISSNSRNSAEGSTTHLRSVQQLPFTKLTPHSLI